MGSSIAWSQHKCAERPVWPVFPDYLFLMTMIIITYPTSSNFCKTSFSGVLLALQFSVFLVSSFMALQFSIFLETSFIEDFLFISFQQKNEIKKGNTLMEFKYLLSCSRIDLFDVKDFKFDRWNLIRVKYVFFITAKTSQFVNCNKEYEKKSQNVSF